MEPILTELSLEVLLALVAVAFLTSELVLAASVFL